MAVATYSISPPAVRPAIPNGSPYIAQGGRQAADLMCRQSGAQTVFTPARLRELYKSKRNYGSLVEKRLTELEKAGWSLPVYRELILADANKVNV